MVTLSELAYLQPDDRATVVVDINERRHNRDEIFAAVQLRRGEVEVGFIKPGFRKELDRGDGANRVGFGRPRSLSSRGITSVTTTASASPPHRS